MDKANKIVQYVSVPQSVFNELFEKINVIMEHIEGSKPTHYEYPSIIKYCRLYLINCKDNSSLGRFLVKLNLFIMKIFPPSYNI